MLTQKYTIKAIRGLSTLPVERHTDILLWKTFWHHFVKVYKRKSDKSTVNTKSRIVFMAGGKQGSVPNAGKRSQF